VKRYLISFGPGAWELPKPDGREFDSARAAVDAIEQAAGNSFIFILGARGVHRAGWPHLTLHKTVSASATVSGIMPMGVDFSLVAVIYEIDVSEGQTAQQAYDAWFDEQDRIAKETRQNELETMRQTAIDKLPVAWEGSLHIKQHEDGDGHTWDRLYVDEDWGDLESKILEMLGDPYLKSGLERIDIGCVRITIERVESDGG
jgi:hypothetical protein